MPVGIGRCLGDPGGINRCCRLLLAAGSARANYADVCGVPSAEPGAGGSRTRSIGGAPVDHPFVGLAGDLGHEFEVGVVVQDNEAARLGGSSHKGVDQG